MPELALANRFDELADKALAGEQLALAGHAAEADYRMVADLGFEIEECAL